jgi:transposase
VKALEAGDTRAALPIAAYKKLYEIEDEICDRDPDAKLAARREHSRPVFDELIAWAEVHQPFEAPSSKLGEALRYLLNHRVALGRFLESGLVPIDNGKVERLHIRAATWGSLCVTPSSTWKPQRSPVHRIAIRATTAASACA